MTNNLKYNPFNSLFYCVLFLGLFLPTNTSFYLPFSNVLMPIREIAFLLLPVINLLCYSENSLIIKDNKLQTRIYLFFIFVILNESLKVFLYSQSVGDSFKSIRLGLPLFCSLILILEGIRVNIEKLWKVLLWAIFISCILSFLSLFFFLPIYSLLPGTDNFSSSEFNGRLYNANYSFGIIGLYLLFSDKEKWYNRGQFVKITNILSIVSLILSFNRTYMALLFIEFIYLAFKSFNAKTAFKIVSIPIVILLSFFSAYNLFPKIHKQVDNRIFNIILDRTSLSESVIDDNRDVIFEGVEKRLNENYWIIGLPYNKEIFLRGNGSDANKLTTTDTSLINVLLRYGIIPLLFFIIILTMIAYKYKFRFMSLLFFIFLIASTNIDSLMRHNSIFFMIICLFISFQDIVKQKISVNE